MFKKILNNLKRPHKIPFKIVSKVKLYLKKKKYNKNFYEDRQNKIFKTINLDRNIGLKKLLEIKNKYKFLRRDMSSEHEVLFSSISSNPQLKVNKILEIGTFDGANAFLLSLLFKDATIETIDLKKNNIDFIKFYNRENKIEQFISSRDEILAKSKNIIFKELNSIKLSTADQKYDLIWIDGAHGYPVVSMDIINSYRLCSENGYVLVDDVWRSVDYSDKFYKSIAAHESLMTLKSSKLINDFHLIPKRLGEEFNLPWTKKYIGFFQC
jgi:predicted O-methyltransferase YrrM